jgi:hypothetical protein
MTEQNTAYRTTTEPTIEYRTAPTATEPTDIAEYRTTAAALALLREKYAAPFDVTTAPGLAAAKAARAEVRGLRGALEKTRAEIKAPVLAQGQRIDAEAKRITAELLAIEEPIDAAIKAEERRKEEEKAAQARAEAERLAALVARVQAIRERVLTVAHRDAAAIRAALEDARAFEPDPDAFAERWPDAMKAIAEVRRALETMLAEREAREAREAEEAARLKAQEEELARQRAELDRLMEPARRRAEAEARRQAELAELDRLRAERERQEAEATAKPAKTRKPAKADPLAEIKDALAAGTLAGPEAIDQAYQLGFAAGECAARQAA